MQHAVDIGAVHVLTEPRGECVDNCPHPDHNAPAHKWRWSEHADVFVCLVCGEVDPA